LRGDRAHTETAVLGQLKKSQQNRATRYSLRQLPDHRHFFLMGPQNLPIQLIGCVNLPLQI
jgi:hypothetical protein